MTTTLRSLFIGAALTLMVAQPACTDGDGTFDEVEVGGEVDGKADAASELRVRAGDTTVWMAATLVRRVGDQGPEYALRGRTSRDLLGGNAYVFDDVYGEFGLRGPRSFDIRWVIRSNAAPLMQGWQQYASLDFAHSATRPDHLTARTIVRPRLDAFTGATSIYLVAELTPVVVDGRIVYRITGRSSRAITSVTAARPGAPLIARAVDANRFVVDLTQADADAIAGVAGADLTITIDGAVKRAHLGLAIKVLGLTTGDAYEVFPPPTCTAETQACLAALPPAATDLSSCGEAVLVRACRR